MKRLNVLIKNNQIALGLSFFVVLTFVILGKEIINIWGYWADIIGPTIYVLFPAAGLLISIVMLLITGKITDKFPSVRELILIEEGAPVIGLTGTVMALVRGFGRLDLTKSVDSAITGVISIINESLLSTAVGLMIGLTAWFVRRRFVPSHLIKDNKGCQCGKHVNSPTRNDLEVKGNNPSMDTGLQSNVQHAVNNATSALINLGYKKSVSENAVNKALATGAGTSEEVIKQALQYVRIGK